MRSYLHKEAYCLMKYASKDGSVVEWIWNSRDGVTPFVITAQDGKTELAHVDWWVDNCVPGYQPLPGERVFVDFTREAAEQSARDLVERYWDDPQFTMAKQWPTREAAYESLRASGLEDVRRREPMVIFARDWPDARQPPERRWRHG